MACLCLAGGVKVSGWNERRLLVLGATGGVGRFVSEEVIRLFGPASLVVGDYKPDRGQEYARASGEEVSFECVDVTRRASIEKAVDGVNAVIVAVQQADPLAQSVCLANGVSFRSQGCCK